MSKSIISTNTIDNSKQPLFFGEGLGMQSYNNHKYPELFEFTNKQLLQFWRPEEITVSKDRGDFKDLTEQEKFIFTKNLGYQILLDSAQSRGIHNLLEYCSNLEVEAFCSWWSAFENLHSMSYSYIVRNIFPNPDEVFNSFNEDQDILKRVNGVTKYYDDMINELPEATEYDKKKALYLTLVSIQILESVRFYVSFACSYYFAEKGKMVGNSSIIKLINRDENLHVGFVARLLKIFRKEESEGFQQIVTDCEDIVNKMWEDAVQEEIEWAKYLFKDGDLVGFNAEILEQYMYYLANLRMKVSGFKRIFPITKNPITWIGKYVDSSSTQTAPQEMEITSYLSNAVDANDLDDLGDLL